jgi:hypothetical protein
MVVKSEGAGFESTRGGLVVCAVEEVVAAD